MCYYAPARVDWQIQDLNKERPIVVLIATFNSPSFFLAAVPFFGCQNRNSEIHAVFGCRTRNSVIRAFFGCRNRNSVIRAVFGCRTRNSVIRAVFGCPNRNSVIRAFFGCPNRNSVIRAVFGCRTRNSVIRAFFGCRLVEIVIRRFWRSAAQKKGKKRKKAVAVLGSSRYKARMERIRAVLIRIRKLLALNRRTTIKRGYQETHYGKP